MLPVTLGAGDHQLRRPDLVLRRRADLRGGAHAIEAAFRIYMLPAGIFSVAVATVLFPTLSRLAARATCGGCGSRWAWHGQ
jgi:putative peptidoglycan lipid II flippase